MKANSAVLTIRAGASGAESQDWAAKLAWMYILWSKRSGFSHSIPNHVRGDNGGTVSIEIVIGGENAAKFLESEIGVHRLARVSPFDELNRRHTSFAVVMLEPSDGTAPMDVIRSYALDPYRLCKDARTKLTTDNVEGVLDGDLTPFMDAFREWKETGKLAGKEDPEPEASA